MALTIKREQTEKRSKNSFKIYGTFDADNSYPTGGYSVTSIHARIKEFRADGGGYIWRYNRTTKKVLAMKINTGNGLLVEETNGTNLSAQTGIQFVATVDLE